LSSPPLHRSPQTVHVAFMSPAPLFFTRGNVEVESHGEEKEEELKIEDLKRKPLRQRYQELRLQLRFSG
jgi:hypothetical protein